MSPSSVVLDQIPRGVSKFVTEGVLGVLEVLGSAASTICAGVARVGRVAVGTNERWSVVLVPYWCAGIVIGFVFMLLSTNSDNNASFCACDTGRF